MKVWGLGAISDRRFAQLHAGSATTSRQGASWPIEQLAANAHPETTVGQILEFYALLLPEPFYRADGGPPRLSVALLQLMNGSLGKMDTERQFTLAPADRRARHSNLRRERQPLQPNKFGQIGRAVLGEVN